MGTMDPEMTRAEYQALATEDEAARQDVPALVRTIVPLVVGWLAVWVAQTLGMDLPLGDATEALTVILSAVYYAVAHALERLNPAFSVLLGSTTQPRYVKPERVNAG